MFKQGSIIAIVLGLLLYFPFACAQDTQKIVVLEVVGAIGPALQDYVVRGIDKAVAQKSDLVILWLDTPGGLDQSMRGIIQKIIASPLPIASYVAPSGARAASAGTYILYASHIAAMAPGTNLGAASPVTLGGGFDGKEQDQKAGKKPSAGMEEKVKSDASAYIRSLAQLRGRNVEWAQKAVLEAASLSAEEAYQLKVIDFVATDIKDLLQKSDGRIVKVQGHDKTLDFTKVKVRKILPDWRVQFLAIITDPNVAYILLLIGVYGLFFEFMNPGFVLPGVVGLVSLLIALYALQLLPINYAGLALIIVGIGFMMAEAFIPSFGALGVGGVIAFIVGSIMLLDSSVPGFQIMLPLIISIALITAGLILFIANFALRARKKPIVSGREEMIGSMGTVVYLGGDEKNARVRIRGELWQFSSPVPLKEGDKVKVVAMDELILIVEGVT